MTDYSYIAEKLKPFGGLIIENCPMAEHTSFRCGGSAALFIEPSGEEELLKTLAVLGENGVAYMFMGNGSNLLFADQGYDGAVIKAGSGFSDISFDGCLIRAGAGVPLLKLSRLAAEHSLTGLEFASGIPGSLGGAVFMNAGAYGGEMSSLIVSVRSADRLGNIRERKAEELDFAYRHSIFSENAEVILSAVIRLEPGDRKVSEEKMRELAAARSAKQPLAYPSAGSFFKRPEGYFAGKLIEDCGLKGLRVGGAMVSELHAGFVINAGKATASDVIDLMHVIQETVMDRFGVMLEPEVKIVGSDNI